MSAANTSPTVIAIDAPVIRALKVMVLSAPSSPVNPRESLTTSGALPSALMTFLINALASFFGVAPDL